MDRYRHETDKSDNRSYRGTTDKTDNDKTDNTSLGGRSTPVPAGNGAEDAPVPRPPRRRNPPLRSFNLETIIPYELLNIHCTLFTIHYPLFDVLLYGP